MHPILFNVGPYNLYTYAVLVGFAYLLGLKLGVARAKARGLNEKHALTLGILIVVSALVGAKLLLLVTDWKEIMKAPSALLAVVGSGGVFFGGLILAVLVTIWYTRRVGLPVLIVGDAAAPGIALAHVVGRFGCFFAGCCYGKPTTVPWAITFRDLFAADYAGTPLDIPLHPTQLYDAGAEALIFLVLLTTESRGRYFPSRTFWLYVLLYAASRFVIEFFRGDPRGHVGVLSTSQFIALLLVPLAIGMLVYLGRRAHVPDPKRTREAA